jgi:DnaK suppressor protein
MTMPSQRKSSGPTRAAKPAKKKPARAAKSVAKERPRAAATRHARPAKPVKKLAAPKKKAVAAPKRKVAPLAKPAAPPQKKGAKAPAPAAQKPSARMKAVPRPPVPRPNVRPLGVLPPEARARGVERSAPHAVALSRPAAARPTKETQKPRGVQRVTEKDLKELETRLLVERARLMKEMGHLESTVLKVNPRDSAGDLSGYSFHMADAGTDAYEREKAFQFASTEGRLLMDLNEALRRLYGGEYGTCESCGNAIAKARLEAMPTARLCRDCKEKEERENRPQQ